MILRASRQWFVDTVGMKDEVIKAVQGVDIRFGCRRPSRFHCLKLGILLDLGSIVKKVPFPNGPQNSPFRDKCPFHVTPSVIGNGLFSKTNQRSKRNFFLQKILDPTFIFSSRPETARSSFLRVLENRPYWCVSRQRVWGAPIPAFYRVSYLIPI